MENFLNEYSKLLDESNEHLSYGTIAVYLNLKENLSNKERSFIEKHLENCALCKEKFNAVMDEDQEFDNIVASTDSGIPQKGSEKVYRINKYWKYSAAALVLIALTAILYFNNSRDEVITHKTETNDPVNEQLVEESETNGENKPRQPEEQPLQSIASNEVYKENRVLENFINRNVRSENSVQIISPKTGDTVKVPVLFKWEMEERLMETRKGKFNIKIVDNKNRIVYEKSIIGFEDIVTKNPGKGVYYWKIELNGKLENVGKFFIK